DPQQFHTEAVNFVRFDGKKVWAAQYGGLVSLQLYYNKDVFAKASVAEPTTDWTWDDFVSTAQKLTVRNGDQTTQWGAALGYFTGWDGGWEMLVAGRGGKLFDANFNPTKLYFDAPQVIDSLQWIQDLVYKYKVAPSQDVTKVLTQAGG